MGKINSKKKGNAFERRIVNWINKTFKNTFKGIKTPQNIAPKIALRTPGSGAFATTSWVNKYSGDIYAPTFKIDKRKVKFECKHYKKMRIFNLWNKHKDETQSDQIPVMVIHANNQDDLVVMDKDDWANIIIKLEQR